MPTNNLKYYESDNLNDWVKNYNIISDKLKQLWFNPSNEHYKNAIDYRP